ncbi:hypothetical protein HUJ05_011168 [Dendroctonus ponderosae]|nr:hypothetical protein HUJ05_011168 [Dendroctonus ponderosae]
MSLSPISAALCRALFAQRGAQPHAATAKSRGLNRAERGAACETQWRRHTNTDRTENRRCSCEFTPTDVKALGRSGQWWMRFARTWTILDKWRMRCQVEKSALERCTKRKKKGDCD